MNSHNCANANFQPVSDPKVNTWMTLFDYEFNDSLLIYHYTNFDTACKIIYGENFKFSKLSSTNDTVESKAKIDTNNSEDKKILLNIITRFEEIAKDQLQLLCFCKDTIINNDTKNKHSQFTDYTGRGFALPRMWAQYADNNKGVCFIIDKNRLLNKLLDKKVYRNKIIHCDDVSYYSFFKAYNINHKDLLELEECFVEKNLIAEYQMFKENIDFVKLNYFKKAKDWEQENEYRILAFSPKQIFIENITECIMGLVLGERIEPYEMKIISELSGNKFDIKKIKFNYNSCTLENLKYKGRDIYA